MRRTERVFGSNGNLQQQCELAGENAFIGISDDDQLFWYRFSTLYPEQKWMTLNRAEVKQLLHCEKKNDTCKQYG